MCPRGMAIAAALALSFAVPVGAASGEESGPPAVAIAIATSGTVEARLPENDGAVPVPRLAWFPEGTLVTTGEGASLVLVFRSGTHWRLKGEAAARLLADGLEGIRGSVERLPDLPAEPHPAAVLPGEVARAALTAVRIRGQGFSVIYPDGGARTLAGATRLLFQPDLSFERYRVEVEDEQGRLRLDLDTRETLVEVPPGVLEPGATYYWRVRTRDALGHLLWEEARFETLPAELEARRMEIIQAGLPEVAPAMVAAVDLELGLWWETREGLAEALRQNPGDEKLSGALERLERLLGWGEGEAGREP